MTKALTSITVPLTIPVPVAGADGKPATRDSLVVARPQTRHVKALAVVIGADLVALLLGGQASDLKEIDPAKIAVDLARKALTADNLDALTGILADLCGETAATIDSLDPVDLFALVSKLPDFFPSLRSFAST